MTTRDVVSEIHQPDGLIPVTPESVSQLVLEVKRLTSALEAKDAEIAEWRQAASVEAGLRREFLARAEAAESRISDLERQLAAETERCARVAENFDMDGLLDTDDLPKGWAGCRRSIAAAIRGGAK